MGYAQRGMAQARQQRPCISSCMRGGAVGYLHGWREAVRRATSQKRRAAVARRCRALPPCGDGLSGCDYPRETVGRRRETGPACGLRQLNQTGGRQVMGKTGQRAGAGGRWAEGERLAVAVLGRAGRERGARVKGGSSYFGLKGSGSGLLGMESLKKKKKSSREGRSTFKSAKKKSSRSRSTFIRPGTQHSHRPKTELARCTLRTNR